MHGACAHSTYAPQATLLAELEDYQLQCWTRDEARHRERQLKRGSFSGLQRGGCSGLQPQRSAARSQAASLHQATRPRSPSARAFLAVVEALAPKKLVDNYVNSGPG